MKKKIYTELLSSHPDDLENIHQYVAWLRFRHHASNFFHLLPQAHWVSGNWAPPPPSAYWV